VGRAASDPAVTAPPGSDEEPGGGELSDPDTIARIIVLRALDRSARTRAELAATLAKRGVPDDAAERVLDRFTEVGLINDAALADGYALAQHRERGLAGRAVAQKLRRRGVPDQTLQAAVDQIDDASEVETAHALVSRKLRSTSNLDSQAKARRLVGMLARKGYSPGLAYRVVKSELADLDEADVDLA
jgi:regulatory protein